jgi:hypothetical protein
MGGYVLTAAGHQAPTTASLINSHAFWYGILLACLIAWILPDLALIVLFAVALFASGLFQSTIGHAHSTSMGALMLILLVLGLLGGVFLGRRRGLQHLGQAEFRTRWRNVLGISRWF